MLKRKMRKWLGVESLDNRVWDQNDTIVSHDYAFTNIKDEYDRLKNMYDSNRMRIDNLNGRLDKAEALIAQLKLIGLPKAIEPKRKPGRPKKIVTTKKGK